jgi:hypothetical protein
MQTIIYCCATCSCDWEIKKVELDILCRTQGRDEKRIQDNSQKIWRKEILGNIGVNGRLNVKWIEYYARLLWARCYAFELNNWQGLLSSKVVIVFYYIYPNNMHMLQSLFYLTTDLYVSGVTINTPPTTHSNQFQLFHYSSMQQYGYVHHSLFYRTYSIFRRIYIINNKCNFDLIYRYSFYQ